MNQKEQNYILIGNFSDNNFTLTMFKTPIIYLNINQVEKNEVIKPKNTTLGIYRKKLMTLFYIFFKVG